MPSLKIKGHQVLSLAGEGSYGIVLKCRDLKTGNIVAVKQFKGPEDENAIREHKILTTLDHQNIVHLHSTFRNGGKLHLIFEYIEKNLLHLIEESPEGLDQDKVQLYIYQLCLAISYCHERNLIHRDVKPENLLINPNSTGPDALKLCDFGVARMCGHPGQQMTDYVATRWYRAPELLLGQTCYSKPVDVWAVGCIMAEIINGKPMFPGMTDVDQLDIIQRAMGPISSSQFRTLTRNGKAPRVKSVYGSGKRTIQERFNGLCSQDAMDFLVYLLKVDGEKRPTIQEALEHPYLLCMKGKELNSSPSFSSTGMEEIEEERHLFDKSIEKVNSEEEEEEDEEEEGEEMIEVEEEILDQQVQEEEEQQIDELINIIDTEDIDKQDEIQDPKNIFLFQEKTGRDFPSSSSSSQQHQHIRKEKNDKQSMIFRKANLLSDSVNNRLKKGKMIKLKNKNSQDFKSNNDMEVKVTATSLSTLFLDANIDKQPSSRLPFPPSVNNKFKTSSNSGIEMLNRVSIFNVRDKLRHRKPSPSLNNLPENRGSSGLENRGNNEQQNNSNTNNKNFSSLPSDRQESNLSRRFGNDKHNARLRAQAYARNTRNQLYLKRNSLSKGSKRKEKVGKSIPPQKVFPSPYLSVNLTSLKLPSIEKNKLNLIKGLTSSRAAGNEINNTISSWV